MFLYPDVSEHLLMELSTIKQKLKDFSDKLDLVNQARESCLNVITKLVNEDKGDLATIGGFYPSELIYEFKDQTFVFNSYLTDTPFIQTQIGIYINDPEKVWVRGLEPVGTYELDTNLEGEHIDDWLWFDKTKKDISEKKGGDANAR
jgi:hypothetical protein